jgi:aminocarboxymuconate-semialdehyde decarboxylase
MSNRPDPSHLDHNVRMPTRREFVRAAAAATGLAFGPSRSGAQQASSAARRQVLLSGRRIPVIDVHAHCGVAGVAAVVKGTPFEANGATAQVLGPARLSTMDAQGVDYQALSINGFWWYGVSDRDLADRIVRAQNDGLAAWCRAHPDRFVAFASSSLQFPELAAAQIEDAVTRLGLRGAAIGGHVAGQDLSDPRFDPFWAQAARLGALVFMHPGGAENIIRNGAFNGRGDLGNIIGNPLETTYFLSRLIFDGVFDRFPALRVCGAHAGGYLPSYFGRTEVACDVRPAAKCANVKRPGDYLRSQILADTMVFSDEGLRHLVAEMGAGQLVYGTDVPFNWPATIDLVLNASYLSDTDKAAILGGNLLRLLRIPA